MGSFITDLKNSFNKGNIYIQFIYINVGVFIVTSLLGILWMLFNRNGAFVLQYLELPAWTLQFVKQPWSLLTYMFMHAGGFIGSGRCFCLFSRQSISAGSICWEVFVAVCCI